MSTVRITVVALALLASLSVGCFEDPVANDTSSNDNGDETGDEACPDGSAGCDCYGNDTCNEGLECADGTCKLPQCVPGSLNCDCYEGQCLTGLVCADGVCKPDDPMMGCESVADCDNNQCTQGDALCGGECVSGIGVQCPIGATCDLTSGSCQCAPGSKPCGNACIPATQCCSSSDCLAGSNCEGGFCTCDGGLMCDGSCLLGASCCPGEVTIAGCSCGAVKTCSPEGIWSECAGGNPNAECQVGQAEPCGNCGTRVCNARCEWSTCQGQGVCMPGAMGCTLTCEVLLCQPACFWEIQMEGDKCC